jgi:hypothetical protein
MTAVDDRECRKLQVHHIATAIDVRGLILQAWSRISNLLVRAALFGAGLQTLFGFRPQISPPPHFLSLIFPIQSLHVTT